MRIFIPIFTVIGTLAAVWFWPGSGTLSAQASEEREPSISAGEQIYADFCASCHGANLEGQDNWRSPGADGKLPAPPHDETGHTWHHGDGLLFDYTKLGGEALMAQRGITFDSGMPAFGDQLSDTEIHDVLAYIKSQWPERIQEMQAVRTEAEELQK